MNDEKRRHKMPAFAPVMHQLFPVSWKTF